MKKKYILLLGVLVFLLAALTVLKKNVSSLILLDHATTPGSKMQVGGFAASNDTGVALETATVSEMMPSDLPYYPVGSTNALDQATRSYEMSAIFSLVVSNVPDYFHQTRDYILSIGGKVLNFQTGTQGRYQSGYLTAKVPVEKFEEATKKVTEGVKSVESEYVSSYDVTGRVASIDDQLTSLKDQKTLKEVELKAAKTELAKTQIQLAIDKLDRQIAALENQSAAQQEEIEYADLSITAATSRSVYNPTARPDLREELVRAYDSVIDNLFVIAQFFVWLVVYSLVLVPVILIIGWLKRRITKNKTV